MVTFGRLALTGDVKLYVVSLLYRRGTGDAVTTQQLARDKSRDVVLIIGAIADWSEVVLRICS